ncbi:MAG: hypothetical protein Q9180_003874, partial [Flavoplaca navasiana]
VSDDLAFVGSDVHQIFLRPAIFVDRPEHVFGRAADLFYRRMAVHKMQELYLSPIIKLEATDMDSLTRPDPRRRSVKANSIYPRSDTRSLDPPSVTSGVQEMQSPGS